MKEIPVLMGAEMVRALLREKNHKSQTRRPLKEQPRIITLADGEYLTWGKDRARGMGNPRLHMRLSDGEHSWRPDLPYGFVGDRLWVKETFCPVMDKGNKNGHDRHIYYRASEVHPDMGKWTPSIHMPRWASRILLENTTVHVERIQDITEAGAKAEGVQFPNKENNQLHYPGMPYSYRQAFERIWDRIYPGSWDRNDWVTVNTFHRLKP